MTEHFDMEGFISAVVTEEDFRHQNTEAEEDDDDLMEAPDDYDDLQDVLVGSRRTQRLRHLERLRRQQRRAAKKKHLEAVTPRLEILQNMPFFIPFPTRVEIFREFVMHDQMRRREGFIDPDHWRMAILERSARAEPRATAFQEILGHQHAKVRRDHVFDDAFEQFYELGDRLKEPIQITFVDRFDTPEAGIDGGGVTKEFLTSVTNEAFMPSSGRALFVENDQHLLYPNPAAVDEHKDLLNRAGHKENSRRWNDSIRNLLQQYEFLGRLIGKCMYEGILVDIHFVPFFLVKWALTGGSGSAANESSYRANINDLRDLDEGLYQGLVSHLSPIGFSASDGYAAPAEELLWQRGRSVWLGFHRHRHHFHPGA
jgi:ubiquitin-protein ligase E3 C